MPDKKLTDLEIKKALELEVNKKSCIHEEYEEACGLWCKHYHKWCEDMSGKNKKDNCSAFKPTAPTKRAKATLSLLNRQEEKIKLLEKYQTEFLKERLQTEELEERLGELEEELESHEFYYEQAQADAYKEVFEKVKEEIAQALENNYKVRQERIAHYENKGELFIGDSFVDYCNGKIDCLRGLDDFCDNLLKEFGGETDV